MAALAKEIANWLHSKDINTDLDLARMVERGLPLAVHSVFLDQGLTKQEFHTLVIPERTFKHRKQRVEHLSLEESDRALRAARVLTFAEKTFGNRERALSWMRETKKRFDGETPMAMLKTEAGARLVEEMLIQIDEGMFA